MSKIFPEFESEGPFPEVAVCGTLSLFCQTIFASNGTFVSEGLKVRITLHRSTLQNRYSCRSWYGAGEGVFDFCGALVSRGLFIDVTVPEPCRSPGSCCIDDEAGGFLAILCQLGIAIAAPTAITITIMTRPCPMRLPVVLMM